MRLTVVMGLLSLCSFPGAAPANVTFEPSSFSLSWMNWQQLNDTNFNPDVNLDTPGMIRRAGYPAEAHVITTEDGYLLTLHRIPGGNDSRPVLLLHALLCTSADWVLLGKDKALAYQLADQGYDVWLGNYRGNTYSRAHTSLSPSDLKFWDFSIHEMGIYDLPAMITFITNMTSQPLHAYIGHSTGATGFYIMASERPKIAQMVKMMINFAPAVFVNNVKSPILHFIAPFWREIKMIVRLLFHDEFLPQSDFLRFLAKYACDQNLAERKLCADFIFAVCGFDREQFDYTLLPVILSHDPAGSSSKTIEHYFQGFQTGKFRKYDYGRVKNLLIYNSLEPPDYNLANIMIPIALFYGPGDWLIDTVDVKRLYRILPNVVDIYEVPWSKFNHVDFVWAKDAPKLVYERALKLINGESPNNITLV
ncbi:Lipase [Camponotus japonicus]